MWTNDPVADAERYTQEQEDKLKKLKKCDMCDNPIQEDYYFEDDGDRFCEDCWKEHVRANFLRFLED